MARPKATHCRRGHRFGPRTLYVNPATGQRRCKVCEAARQAAYAARRKEAA